MYTVSITSQGQMSIPAPLRRLLGFDKMNKANVFVEEDALVVRPIKDFLDLAGTFKTRKKATSRQIREAFGNYLAKQGAGIK